jgi:hypothetical protein
MRRAACTSERLPPSVWAPNRPLAQVLGLAHADVAATLNNLGIVYDDMGKKETALHHYKVAPPPSHRRPHRRRCQAQPRHTLNPINRHGRNAVRCIIRCVCALQRSLQIKQQLLGADDPELLTTISNIADIYREQVRRKRPRRNATSQRAMSSPEHAVHITNMLHAAHTGLAASQDTIVEALNSPQAQPLSTAVHWRVSRSNPTALCRRTIARRWRRAARRQRHRSSTTRWRSTVGYSRGGLFAML